MRQRAIIAAVVVLILLLVGGFLLTNKAESPSKELNQTTTTPPTSNTSPAPSTSREPTLELTDSKFTPETLTVKAGQKITFTNKGTQNHTVTSDDGMSFNSGNVAPNQTVEITAPSTPGSYPFHCTPHPNLTGTLIVE